MRIEVITLFPGLFNGFLKDALIKRALQKGLLDLKVYSLRTWARSKHQQVDDYPFGGGSGMVLKPEPIFAAVESLTQDCHPQPKVVHFTPQGELLSQEIVEELSSEAHLLFICGRYKGVDQRVVDHLVDREISIGDYVLSGGELPALVLIEAMTRLIPGVINDIESARTDSFQKSLLEGPLYTRPEEYHGMRVPEILLSGDHAKVADWRIQKAMEITKQRRPDLWQRYLQQTIQKDKT
ncbi:MAG: tRNA (guanosine(37)-N1)-methyltransferase TrmD [bacterium]